MIGLDTNVVVRALVTDDDPAQSTAVRDLLESLTSTRPGWISSVALAESFWVLRRVYRLAGADIARALSVLTQSENILVEQPAIVRSALMAAADGADLADALIALAARKAGGRVTMTFDRRAADTLDGMELLHT